MNTKLWTVLVFAASLALNGLAGTTRLGGNTTAEVSDAYPNLFAPAGVTFAIWGVIYLLLIGYGVRLFSNFGQKKAKAADKLALAIMPHFMLVSALNAAWLIAWQYRVFWLSIILIIGMLVTLIRISKQTLGQKLSLVDWATIRFPFSVYFGWVTVATIANITVWLVSINWTGWGISAVLWTGIILIVGAIIGTITAWQRRDWAYLLVFVWAYTGIWLKHTSPEGHNGAYPGVMQLLTLLIAVFSLITIWVAYKWPKGITEK